MYDFVLREFINDLETRYGITEVSLIAEFGDISITVLAYVAGFLISDPSAAMQIIAAGGSFATIGQMIPLVPMVGGSIHFLIGLSFTLDSIFNNLEESMSIEMINNVFRHLDDKCDIIHNENGFISDTICDDDAGYVVFTEATWVQLPGASIGRESTHRSSVTIFTDNEINVLISQSELEYTFSEDVFNSSHHSCEEFITNTYILNPYDGEIDMTETIIRQLWNMEFNLIRH